MTMPLEALGPADDAGLQQVAALFGGPTILHQPLETAFDAHEMLDQGLPGAALRHLVDSLDILRRTDMLEKAIGMSLRTFQRRKEEPERPLSPEQSGRAWKFAEIVAAATSVFGSRDAAEQWLVRPALALDRRRPIDLLTTPAGVSLVETLLVRLKYGVYT
jgi:putative toxin-antitoxin system antitoxin component (TIGR02293 family)